MLVFRAWIASRRAFTPWTAGRFSRFLILVGNTCTDWAVAWKLNWERLAATVVGVELVGLPVVASGRG